MNAAMFKYKEITDIILRSFYEAYNELGDGFLESVYENALMISVDRWLNSYLFSISPYSCKFVFIRG